MSDAMLSEVDTHRQRSAEFVKGLREFADFLAAHPDLPVPVAGSHNAFAADKAMLATIARTGVRWTKRAIDEWFYLSVSFTGGHTYDVNLSREQVCRKVVTGTRLVPAVAAREVEEYHWVCDEPLLAETGGR